MSEITSTSLRFENGEYQVQQYRAMTDGRSYRWKVVGFLKVPRRDFTTGRLTSMGTRQRGSIENRLSKNQAFALANSLNRLNDLPLHDPNEYAEWKAKKAKAEAWDMERLLKS